MTEDQTAEMKAAYEKLTTSAQSLFTKMYENMQGAGAGPDMGDMGAGAQSQAPEDDIIDGDFREV